MAISNILPRKTMTNRTRRQSMADRLNYDQKVEKTNGGELISSYMCTPETAADEFEISKQLYDQLTGRSLPKKRDIIMYRIIQSFKPREVSAEEAHKIAYELAMEFTGGQHQFVVSTHIDKEHIHSHIEFNSTNLDCNGKFKNVKNSAMLLRDLNDRLCREHGLSVIEHPREKGKSYGEAAAAKYGVSWKEQLRQTIDKVIADARGYDDFLQRMRYEGYEIRITKYLAFRAPGQERFTRSFRLGNDYTAEALRARSEHRREYSVTKKKSVRGSSGRPVNLQIDIQAKIDAGKGAGYERWVKTFNLKEAAKTLNFLIDNDLTDYETLKERAEQASSDFDASARKIKRLEARMSEVQQLRTHIIQYAKTRDVYAAYRKSRHKKEFRAAHAVEIAQHEEARKAFDALNGKPIPKVAQLSEQYAALLDEKKREYERYKKLRNDMITYKTVLHNVDRILGTDEQEKNTVRSSHEWSR